MIAISLRALMIAIGSMVADRDRILARIEQEGAQIDAEEKLSELVIEIDNSLSELADAYEEQRTGTAGYPDYEDLVANALQSGRGHA